MRARDQSSIFSNGRKFCPGYRLLLELHALTLVTRSYALLMVVIAISPTPFCLLSFHLLIFPIHNSFVLYQVLA